MADHTSAILSTHSKMGLYLNFAALRAFVAICRRRVAPQFVEEVEQKRQMCQRLLVFRIVRDERREAFASGA